VVLATGRYIGEGFDDSRLDTSYSRCRSRGREPPRGGPTVRTVEIGSLHGRGPTACGASRAYRAG
jgi:hypothetical protein